jgi:hypothetical protein
MPWFTGKEKEEKECSQIETLKLLLELVETIRKDLESRLNQRRGDG